MVHFEHTPGKKKKKKKLKSALCSSNVKDGAAGASLQVFNNVFVVLVEDYL